MPSATMPAAIRATLQACSVCCSRYSHTSSGLGEVESAELILVLHLVALQRPALFSAGYDRAVGVDSARTRSYAVAINLALRNRQNPLNSTALRPRGACVFKP